jgi:acetyl esterase/lipase
VDNPRFHWTVELLADLQTWFLQVYGGGGEVLIDSIKLFTKKLQQAHSTVELVVTPGVAHDDIILDKILGYKEKAEGTKAIESWLAQRLDKLGY